MKKYLIAGLLTVSTTTVFAETFSGPLIAAFYMETMSTPKGWELSYKGKEGPVQVFTMRRDLDAYPQTAIMSPLDQMQRLMCGDDSLKNMMKNGLKVRVDAKDKVDGKIKTSKGPILSSCPSY
ncbi:hypothetical protein [Advenella sp. EE-W14]|uniref:hypothetical protein n=1 Tax=Advenella sp. EE-W14 TaxID=2722705 RepID=UPI00145F225D|nr:hypothetical protein [Advenella sp. EE-W14]